MFSASAHNLSIYVSLSLVHRSEDDYCGVKVNHSYHLLLDRVERFLTIVDGTNTGLVTLPDQNVTCFA